MIGPGEPASPLVARDAEIAALLAAVAAAAEGRGGAVVLTGAAGMGKSRLVDIVRAQAHERGLTVSAHRAAELDRDSPGRSLTAAGLPLAMEQTPFHAVDRLGAVLESIAGSGPLAIIIDDSQWIDELSALALRVLVPQLLSFPVLWVLARRPLPPGPGNQAIDWLVGGWARELRLEPLDATAVTQVCRHLLGADPGASVRDVAARANGNPYLLEVTLRTMRAAGQVEIADDQAVVIDGPMPVDLLAAARELLMRGLSPATAELLEAGAVLGRPFSIPEAEAVRVVRPNAFLAPAVEALAASVLQEEGTQLRYAHDLLREAVYQSMPGPIRAALHRRAAEVVARSGGSALEVAEHHLRSGPDGTRAAVQALREAAAQLSAHAPGTAADLLLQAIDRLDRTDPVRARLSAEAVGLVAASGQVDRARELAEVALLADLDRATEAGALLGLAEALKHAGHNALSVRYARRALATDGVPEPIQAQLHAIAAHALLWGDDVRLADEAGAQAQRLGAASGEVAAQVFGGAARSVVAREEGRLADAYGHAAEAVRLADEHGRRARHRHPRIWLGSALAALDRLDEAQEVLRAGRREAELLGTGWSAPLWQFYLATAMVGAGDLETARVEGEAGLLLARQLTALQLAVGLHGLLARIATERDQLPEAHHHIRALRLLLEAGRTAAPEDLAWADAVVAEADGRGEDALAAIAGLCDQMPARLHLLSDNPGCGPLLVRIALGAGDRRRAAAAAAAAQALALGNPQVASAAGAAAHARGLLDGDRDALAEAVRALDGSPRRLDRALAREDWARAEFDHDRERAIDLIESAIELYQECGAHRARKRATQTLRSWGVRRAGIGEPRSRPTRYGLSAKELEVAQAVADGLTNREIGARLYISHHTVDTHLRNIFGKTGVNSRAALARLLATGG